MTARPFTRGDTRPARVCIVSPAAWGALTAGVEGHAGGVEHQTALMGRWLAANGFDVSLVVWDEGQSVEHVDGVRVLRLCRRSDGVPGLRFLHPRWTSLNRALRAADADVYYQNCGEYVTGQVALWCRRHSRRFIFSVASDPECDPRLPTLPKLRERALYKYGLKCADRIIVQTHRQQAMLREGFLFESIVLPMPCPGPAEGDPPVGRLEHPPRVVWVGRVSREKRPEELIAIARTVPDVRFDLVGPLPDAWAESVARRAAALPNVRVRGRVARRDMDDVYRGAAALICTSAFEGFPNTFLEAWSHGVPVVTTVDPDQLVATRRLGLAAAGQDALIQAVRRLTADRREWQSISARARAYYLAHHTVEKAMPHFAELFLQVCGLDPHGHEAAVERGTVDSPCAF